VALLCDFVGLEYYELSTAILEMAIDRAVFFPLKDTNGGGNCKKNTSNITKSPREQGNITCKGF